MGTPKIKFLAEAAKYSSMPLETPSEDEILRKESEMNFAQRPRYLLKFAQKQYSFKKFLVGAALSSSKLTFEVATFS